MLVAIVGESCTGKSTLAQRLQQFCGAEIFTGKDYLRLAKNESIAQKLFLKKLTEAVSGSNIIYVITEREHLKLLPQGTVIVLMTADMDLICQRFAQRMRGNLPEPVRAMLEKKHGLFDGVDCDYHIHNNGNIEDICQSIAQMGR